MVAKQCFGVIIRISEPCGRRSGWEVYRSRDRFDNYLIPESDLLEQSCICLSSKGPSRSVDVKGCYPSMAVVEMGQGAFSHVGQGRVRDLIQRRCVGAYFK